LTPQVLIVDTGPLVAIADTDDEHYAKCLDLLEAAQSPLVTTGLVIAEAGYLLTRNHGPAAEIKLVEMICDQTLIIEPLTAADWVRVGELVERYQDLPLGVTDASLIAIAERHQATDIATLDRRHFRVVRPTHCRAFALLPDGVVEPSPTHPKNR
jgi:uncharacterized protein